MEAFYIAFGILGVYLFFAFLAKVLQFNRDHGPKGMKQCWNCGGFIYDFLLNCPRCNALQPDVEVEEEEATEEDEAKADAERASADDEA